MAKSKITYKSKGFPRALCILAVLEVQAPLKDIKNTNMQ